MRKQKVQKAYDKNSKLYNKMLGGKTLWAKGFQKAVWGFGLSGNALERAVVDFLPDDFNGKLLDIPVGTGLFTKEKYAKMTNAEITGVDYSRGMLDRAAEAYAETGAKVRLQQGDAANLPFADETFDIVLTMNGLPCFPEKEKSLNELLRVLKSGGALIGCSYVTGKKPFTDLVVGKIYPLIGYTTPPFQTEKALTLNLTPHFTSVKTRSIGPLLAFKCNAKTPAPL
jgi:ubiquinone/menaquinone biosynthesis C-methylase UbiE